MAVQKWIMGARPRTLPAAVVPVAVGTAVAVGTEVIWWRATLALVVSLALQVGTNFANDYSDGVRGTDGADRVGPPRLVGDALASPAQVKRAAQLSFMVAGLAGLGLAAAAGWWLLVVGAASIAAGALYTGGPRPYGYLGLGELFVFVFFGLVATTGSFYVQAEVITGLSVTAAVPVGLWATALLVINNLRDIPGDTAVGKRTLAVRLGDRRTRVLYGVILAAAFVMVGVVALTRPWAALGLFGVVVAVGPARTVKHGAKGVDLIPVLAATGRVQLAGGLLLAAGVALSG